MPQNKQTSQDSATKGVTLAETTAPTTLSFGEHNARRRRGKVVPTPGKGKEHHTAPHKPAGDSPEESNGLLHTYSQFPPQNPLHE